MRRSCRYATATTTLLHLHTRFTALPGASQQTQARKLQALKDRLTTRTDEIAHTKTVVGKESIELDARKEQRDKVCERIVGVLKEMDMEAAARAEAKVQPLPSRPVALYWAAPHRTTISAAARAARAACAIRSARPRAPHAPHTTGGEGCRGRRGAVPPRVSGGHPAD